MSYYQKYLKYKSKYLGMKGRGQIGGVVSSIDVLKKAVEDAQNKVKNAKFNYERINARKNTSEELQNAHTYVQLAEEILAKAKLALEKALGQAK